MRDRCKKLAFLTQFHLQYASARILREEKLCFFVDNKWFKKRLVAMRNRCKKIVSFSLNFTYNSLQGTVLEKKCLIFC